MIATGISSGARTLYTDDEEHTFTVRRPVIFNGIPGDLTERSDLASRTIKLEIPRIVQRRTKSDLEREGNLAWGVGRIVGWVGWGFEGSIFGEG